MADEKPQDDVTTQPSISTEEAEQTDVELSPVGDEKVEVVPDEPRSVEYAAADIEVRDAAKREIDVRLLPWDTVVETVVGPEMFVRGSMAETRADDLLLMGLEHEAHLGLGQDGQAVLTRRPVGRGTAFDERDDGPHATFRVAATQAGDELLALAAERIVRGVSVEFSTVPGGTEVQNRNGRRTRVHKRVQVRGASLTYRPAYGEQAAVLAVRSQHEGDGPMAEAQEAPAGADAPLPQEAYTGLLTQLSEQFNKSFEQVADRFEQLETRMRQDITIPVAPANDGANRATRGQWMQAVLRMLSGDRVADSEMRVLADLVTTDNIGVVPDAYSTEIIGVIDPLRRFMSSTRRLETPSSGMGLVVPKIVTKPLVQTQDAEKGDVASQATSITTVTYDAVTKAGGGDISLQLLKRSSPSFLSLYLELLAEAYAIETEESAVEALLGEAGVVDGGTLDPDNLSLGAAWQAGATIRKPPTHIWMSSAAVGAFIDAKASGTNAPLYSDLRADITAGGGLGGSISGLRPVWVPALDGVDYEQADVVVGPSTGFGWAEDGTYTLQVDVPAKAGRDVAIVGILWFAPMYPTAFTRYVIGS